MFTGRESHTSLNTMAYSIASGRYFYEEGGDFFAFDALIDEMDHSGAGTFKNGQRIEDESYSPSPGFFVLDTVENFSGDPWNDGKFDAEFWDVKSYFDSDSGITKNEISGTGYDNGLPSLTTYGLEGEVEVDGIYRSFNTEDQLDFGQAPTPRPTPKPTPVAPAPQPTPVAPNPERPQHQDEIIGMNKVIGSSKKDRLKGTNGADEIFGYGGNDVISGANGDDLIDPGMWTSGKFDKVKGGKGSDTFVVKDGYWAFIKDFNVIEDKLDVSGLSQGLDWNIKGSKTYIYGDDGYEVARLKGQVDLSDASFV